MRPSATRPTSFWRGESGPFVGLSDAPILIAISSQGFLMRSRMRVWSCARRGDGVMAAFQCSSGDLLVCAGCAFAIRDLTRAGTLGDNRAEARALM